MSDPRPGTPRPAPTRPGPARVVRKLVAALATLVVLASGTALAPRSAAQSAPMPDFQLRDVNPNSPRSGRMVSPRDYRLQISAYYFGAAG